MLGFLGLKTVKNKVTNTIPTMMKNNRDMGKQILRPFLVMVYDSGWYY